MKRFLPLALLFLLCCCKALVSPLPSLGGAGLSGLYAADCGGTLVVAGGCNFPDVPAAEGGKKVFYDEIMALGADGWSVIGHLPEASAYGAYAAVDGGLLLAGGANASGTLSEVWMVRPDSVEVLPALPKPIEQAAWCAEGGHLWLAGGLSDGEPSLDVYEFDGSSWVEIAKLPSPIVQGVATSGTAETGSIVPTLCVWGGYDPVEKSALTGGYSLDLGTGEWTPLEADVTFVGSACLDGIAVGGCDAGVFTSALRLPADKVREYQSQPVEYYRFRGEALHLDGKLWKRAAASEHLARAGAAVARYDGGLVLIGGELKPGIRTPEVWSLTIE